MFIKKRNVKMYSKKVLEIVKLGEMDSTGNRYALESNSHL